MDIDDIEPCKRDPLKHDKLHLWREFRAKNKFRYLVGGVCTITPYSPADNAVQAQTRVDGADDSNVAAVPALEGAVVETNHVRDGGACHKRRPLLLLSLPTSA
jgi:hypothetical protein